MEVCIYKVLGIELGMVKIKDEFYCTTNQLQRLFAESSNTIRKAMNRNAHRFSGTRLQDLLCVTKCTSQEFRKALGVRQLRKDAVLWSSSDVLSLGMILCGKEAHAFQSDIIAMLKKQAVMDMVPKEHLEAALATNKTLMDMKNDLEGKYARLEQSVLKIQEQLGIAASNAGRTLRLVKNTKEKL